MTGFILCFPSVTESVSPDREYVLQKRARRQRYLSAPDFQQRLRVLRHQLAVTGDARESVFLGDAVVVHQALLDELSLEDRINEEVRVILDAYSEEMRKSGAQYAEMFKKV